MFVPDDDPAERRKRYKKMSNQPIQYKMPCDLEINAVILEARRMQAEHLAGLIQSAVRFIVKLPSRLHIHHPRLTA